MALRLSEGAIAAIMQGEDSVKPILQLINIRPISTENAPRRYRLLMSDGVNTLSSCMLATQLNSLIDDKSLTANTICQINRFIVNTLKDGRRVMIVMDLTVLRAGDATTPKIGNPVQYVEGAGQGTKPLQSPALASNQAPSQPPQLQSSSPAAGVSSPSGKVTSFSGSSHVHGKGPCSDLINTPGGSKTKVVPIASLNPYQSKWTICARVTQKGQIRTWSNSRGEGKLFSIELVDDSGEIRATAFNEQVDKFYPLIELNKVYYFSKAHLKTAKKQYTSVKNDYEITFTNDTSVVPCEHPQHFPYVQFDFVSIGNLESVNKDSIVDVIGICKSYEDAAKITIKSSNREVFKRDIHMMDMSGKTVTVTLWGAEAERFDGSQQPVVAIKGARVSDFGGRSLSAITSSTIIINPDRPESFKLRGWFDSEGQLLEAPSISNARTGPMGDGSTNWKTLREVKTENLGKGDKPDYYSCIGTVIYMWKEKCMYKACPSPDCNKKVIDEQNGLYRCEKCDQEFPNFKYRMFLPVNIVDFQDYQWITCFHEAAEVILGQNATYLGELKEKNEQAFVEVLEKSLFTTFEFRIRIKLESYNDEPRMKATVLDVRPVNHKEHSKRLIMTIRRNAQLLG